MSNTVSLKLTPKQAKILWGVVDGALDARQWHGYPDKYVEGRRRPHNHNGYEDLVVRRVEVPWNPFLATE